MKFAFHFLTRTVRYNFEILICTYISDPDIVILHHCFSLTVKVKFTIILQNVMVSMETNSTVNMLVTFSFASTSYNIETVLTINV